MRIQWTRRRRCFQIRNGIGNETILLISAPVPKSDFRNFNVLLSPILKSEFSTELATRRGLLETYSYGIRKVRAHEHVHRISRIERVKYAFSPSSTIYSETVARARTHTYTEYG